jgi:hypothetical protein
VRASGAVATKVNSIVILFSSLLSYRVYLSWWEDPRYRDDVYMALPPGIPSSNSGVVLPRKALYGLKQAPRLWWQLIHSFLVGLGFRQSHADPNLYISDGVHVLLYVDDILILTAPGASRPSSRTALR